MKTLHTENLYISCPSDKLDCVVTFLKENGCTVEDEYLPAEEVCDFRPSTALRGARGKEEMTQVELAKRTGLSVRRIRDMEHGRCPIDETTAKVLGQVLNIGYKVFL